METIILEPKNKKELAVVNEFVERTKIKARVKKKKAVISTDKTNKEILDSIERGYREAQLHNKGKIKLNTLKEFLDEL